MRHSITLAIAFALTSFFMPTLAQANEKITFTPSTMTSSTDITIADVVYHWVGVDDITQDNTYLTKTISLAAGQRRSGIITVTFQWRSGAKHIDIRSVKAYGTDGAGVPIAVDEHIGYAGSGSTNNVYTLVLGENVATTLTCDIRAASDSTNGDITVRTHAFVPDVEEDHTARLAPGSQTWSGTTFSPPWANDASKNVLLSVPNAATQFAFDTSVIANTVGFAGNGALSLSAPMVPRITTLHLGGMQGDSSVNFATSGMNVIAGTDTILTQVGAGVVTVGTGKQVTFHNILWPETKINLKPVGGNPIGVVAYSADSTEPALTILPFRSMNGVNVLIKRPMEMSSQLVFGMNNISQTYTFQDTSINAPGLRTCSNANTDLHLDGTTITVTGSANTNSAATASIVIGHWHKTTNMSMTNKSELLADKAIVYFGADSHVYFTAKDSTLDVAGVSIGVIGSPGKTRTFMYDNSTLKVRGYGYISTNRGTYTTTFKNDTKIYALASAPIESASPIQIGGAFTLAVSAGQALTMNAKLVNVSGSSPASITFGDPDYTGTVTLNAGAEARYSTLRCSSLNVDAGRLSIMADLSTAGATSPAVAIAKGATLFIGDDVSVGSTSIDSDKKWTVDGTLSIDNWSSGEALGRLAPDVDRVTIDGGEVIFRKSGDQVRAFNVGANGAKLTVEEGQSVYLKAGGSTIVTGAVLTFDGAGNAVIGNAKIGEPHPDEDFVSNSFMIEKLGSGELTLNTSQVFMGGTLDIRRGTVRIANKCKDAVSKTVIYVDEGASLVLDTINLQASSLEIKPGALLRLNYVNTGRPIQIIGDADLGASEGSLSIKGAVYFNDDLLPTGGYVSRGAFFPAMPTDVEEWPFGAGFATTELTPRDISPDEHLILKTIDPKAVLEIKGRIICKSFTLDIVSGATLRFVPDPVTGDSLIQSLSTVDIGNQRVNIDLSELGERLYYPAISETIRSTIPIFTGQLTGEGFLDPSNIRVLLSYTNGIPDIADDGDAVIRNAYRMETLIADPFGVFCVIKRRAEIPSGSLSLSFTTDAVGADEKGLLYEGVGVTCQPILPPFHVNELAFISQQGLPIFQEVNKGASLLVTGPSQVASTGITATKLLREALTAIDQRTIQIFDVPFKQYRTIVYFANDVTDDSDVTDDFVPVQINGRYYTGYKKSDTAGYTIPDARATWGKNNKTGVTAEGRRNVLISDVLTGHLQINVQNIEGAASTIAGLQIVEIVEDSQEAENVTVTVTGAVVTWGGDGMELTPKPDPTDPVNDDWKKTVQNATVILTQPDTTIYFEAFPKESLDAPSEYFRADKLTFVGGADRSVTLKVGTPPPPPTEDNPAELPDPTLLVNHTLAVGELDFEQINGADVYFRTANVVPPLSDLHLHADSIASIYLSPSFKLELNGDLEGGYSWTTEPDPDDSDFVFDARTTLVRENKTVITSIPPNKIMSRVSYKNVDINGSLNAKYGLDVLEGDSIALGNSGILTVNGSYNQAEGSTVSVAQFRPMSGFTIKQGGDLTISNVLVLNKGFFRQTGGVTKLSGWQGATGSFYFDEGSLIVTPHINGKQTSQHFELGAIQLSIEDGTAATLSRVITFNAPLGRLTTITPGQGRTLTLSGTNLGGGDIVIDAGRVKLTKSQALGNAAKTVTIGAGATLEVTVAEIEHAKLVFRGAGHTGQTALDIKITSNRNGPWQITKSTDDDAITGQPLLLYNGVPFAGTIAKGMVTRSSEPSTPRSLNWVGPQGLWAVDESVTPWSNGGGASAFSNRDNVNFPNVNTSEKAVSLVGAIVAGTMTFENTTGSYFFSSVRNAATPASLSITNPATFAPWQDLIIDVPLTLPAATTVAMPTRGTSLSLNLFGTKSSKTFTYAHPLTVTGGKNLTLTQTNTDETQVLSGAFGMAAGTTFTKRGAGKLSFSVVPTGGFGENTVFNVMEGTLTWGPAHQWTDAYSVKDTRIERDATMELRVLDITNGIPNGGSITVEGALVFYQYNEIGRQELGRFVDLTLRGGTIDARGGSYDDYPACGLTTALIVEKANRPSYLKTSDYSNVMSRICFRTDAVIDVREGAELRVEIGINMAGNAGLSDEEKILKKLGSGRLTWLRSPTHDKGTLITDGALAIEGLDENNHTITLSSDVTLDPQPRDVSVGEPEVPPVLTGLGTVDGPHRITVKKGAAVTAGLTIKSPITFEGGSILRLDYTGEHMLYIEKPTIPSGISLKVEAFDPEATIVSKTVKIIGWDDDSLVGENVSFEVSDEDAVKLDAAGMALLSMEDGLYLMPQWKIAATINESVVSWHDAMWSYTDASGAAVNNKSYDPVSGRFIRAEITLDVTHDDSLGYYRINLSRNIDANRVDVLSTLVDQLELTFVYNVNNTNVSLPQNEGDVTIVQFLPVYPTFNQNDVRVKFEVAPFKDMDLYTLTLTGSRLTIARRSKYISININLGAKDDNSTLSSADGAAGVYPVLGGLWNNVSATDFPQNPVATQSITNSIGQGGGTLTYQALKMGTNESMPGYDSRRSPNAKLTTGFFLENESTLITDANFQDPPFPKAPNNRGWQIKVSGMDWNEAVVALDVYVIFAASYLTPNYAPLMICDDDYLLKWHAYTPMNGMTGRTDGTMSWLGDPQSKDSVLFEGRNFLRVRILRTDEVNLDVIHLTQGLAGKTEESACGPAAIQIVGIEGSTGDYHRKHASGDWSSANWVLDERLNQTWNNGSPAESGLVDNPWSRAIFDATNGGVTIDRLVVANQVSFVGAGRRDIRGDEPLITSAVDFSAFLGDVTLSAPISGWINPGEGATFRFDESTNDREYDYSFTPQKAGEIKKNQIDNRIVVKGGFNSDLSIEKGTFAIRIDAGADYEYLGTLSGPGIFEKTGPGTLTINSHAEQNSTKLNLEGGYLVTEGTLRINGTKYVIPPSFRVVGPNARLELYKTGQKNDQYYYPSNLIFEATDGGVIEVAGATIFPRDDTAPDVFLGEGSSLRAYNTGGGSWYDFVHIGEITARGDSSLLFVGSGTGLEWVGIVCYTPVTVEAGKTLIVRDENTGGGAADFSIRAAGPPSAIFDVAIGATLRFEAAVGSAKPIVKRGAGRVEFHRQIVAGRGTPQLNQSVTVEAGTWVQNCPFTPTSSQRFIVKSDATLAGSGSFGEFVDVMIEENASIQVGDGGGTLTIHTLTLTNGAVLNLSTASGELLDVTNRLNLTSTSNAFYHVLIDNPIVGVQIMKWPTLSDEELERLKVDWIAPKAFSQGVKVVARVDGLWLEAAQDSIYSWGGNNPNLIGNWWGGETWTLGEGVVSYPFSPETPPSVKLSGGAITLNHYADGNVLVTDVEMLLGDIAIDGTATISQEPTKNTELRLTQSVWKQGPGSLVLDVPLYVNGTMPLTVDGGTLTINKSILTANAPEGSIVAAMPISLLNKGATLVFDVASDPKQILKGALSGHLESEFVKKGIGTLELEARYEMQVPITVEAGTLELSNTLSSVVSIDREIALTVEAGASLKCTTASALGNNPSRILRLNSDATLVEFSANGSFIEGRLELVKEETNPKPLSELFVENGGLKFRDDLVIDVEAGTSLDLGVPLDTEKAVSSHKGTLTKHGAGELILSNTLGMTFTNPFVIEAGAVRVKGIYLPDAIEATELDDWTLKSGATLILSGSVGARSEKMEFGDAELICEKGSTLALSTFIGVANGNISRATLHSGSTVSIASLGTYVTFDSLTTPPGVINIDIQAMPEEGATDTEYTLLSWSARRENGSFVLAGDNVVALMEKGYALKEVDNSLKLVMPDAENVYIWRGLIAPDAADNNNWFATGDPNEGPWKYLVPQTDSGDPVQQNATWKQGASVTLPDVLESATGVRELAFRTTVDMSGLLDENNQAGKGYTLKAYGANAMLELNGILLKTGTAPLTIDSQLVVPSGGIQVNAGELILKGNLFDSGNASAAQAAFSRSIYLASDAELTFEMDGASTTNRIHNVIAGDGTLSNKGVGTTVVTKTLQYVKQVNVKAGTLAVLSGEAVLSASPVKVAKGATLAWGNALNQPYEPFNTQIDPMQIDPIKDAESGSFKWDGNVQDVATIATQKMKLEGFIKSGVGKLLIERANFDMTDGASRMDLNVRSVGADNALLLGEKITPTTSLNVGNLSGAGMILASPAFTSIERKIDVLLTKDTIFSGTFAGSVRVGTRPESLLSIDVGGAHTWTLSGRSAASLGTLTVKAGTTLALDGAWRGAADVSGTVKGTGEIGATGKAVTVKEAAVLDPGSSSTTPLTIVDELILHGGAKLRVYVGGNGNVSKITADKLSVSGGKPIKIEVVVDTVNHVFASNATFFSWTYGDSALDPSFFDLSVVDTNDDAVEGHKYSIKIENRAIKLMSIPQRQWIIVR